VRLDTGDKGTELIVGAGQVIVRHCGHLRQAWSLAGSR
jgi:hypothetical protein